ncbi:MAG: WD40 repeat domain-containing protein [Alphaproteobacteria bacterium]
MHNPPSAIAQQWNLGVRVNALTANASGTRLAAALGDGRLALLAADDGPQEPSLIHAHDGISLSLAACGDDFISGGDDGSVVRVGNDSEPKNLFRQKGKWIDHAAADPDGGIIAAAYGKNIQLLDGGGQPLGAPLLHPGSIGGMAFSPNGKRLAASHLNGVSLWWTNAKEQKPVVLPWKGSHLAVAWHPDGKIVMTAMQESALHGWRLADMNEMRMQGYAGKISAMRFSPRGRYLFTSGAAQAIGWPFFGGGPWGKAPIAIGTDRGMLASEVAPHPKDDIVAIGSQDGMIELAPTDGRPAVMIHPPVAEQGSAVTGLAWNSAGTCLFAALESGYLMLFTIDSVANAVKQ